MKPSQLNQLTKLAALRVAQKQGKLAYLEAQAAPVKRALTNIDTRDALQKCPDGGTYALTMREQIAWEVWRQTERKRLTIELAKYEARLIPLRQVAARETARKRVLENFAKKYL